MTIALSTPVTGTAQTGFTSPTYTLTTDNPPAINAKQWAVTALGGTQAGVTVSSVSSPFTIAVYRPAKFASAGTLNANGVLTGVGYNDYAFVVRKGMVPLAGQQPLQAQFTLKMHIPAGADAAAPAEIRAALSLLFGAVSQVSAGTGDTLVTGLL
jgi:hypothetical protein